MKIITKFQVLKFINTLWLNYILKFFAISLVGYITVMELASVTNQLFVNNTIKLILL